MRTLITVCTLLLLFFGASPTLAQESGFTFIVDHVKIDAPNKAVRYHANVDGQERTISYILADREHVNVIVKDGRGETLLRLRASEDEVRGRAAGKRFRATPDAPATFAPRTDRRAVWLLEHDLLGHPTLGIAALMEDLQEDEEEEDTQALGYTSIISDLWSLIQIWDWMTDGEDCLNPNQKTQCTETDVNGNQNVVTFECSCGTPICNQVNMSVDVPVRVQDASTGEVTTETETRVYSKCQCYCMEMTFPMDN
jgi:hypothetical protein